MSPTPSANAAHAEPLVPDAVLDDDELVLLAVKPSAWFVALVSWPVIAAAGAVAAGAYVAGDALGSTAPPMVHALCLAGALLRLIVASFQWLGRTYVLTDKRVMWIEGVLRVAVVQCPLRHITRTDLTATRGERVLGLATLVFEAEPLEAGQPGWANLSRAAEVRQAVEEAIRRARAR